MSRANLFSFFPSSHFTKKLFFLAALAAGITTASAQTPGSAQGKSGPMNHKPVTGDPVTGDPVTGDPVTGDPVIAANQGTATTSDKPQSIGKNAAVKFGAKKQLSPSP